MMCWRKSLTVSVAEMVVQLLGTGVCGGGANTHP
jgi:hypothetical protein